MAMWPAAESPCTIVVDDWVGRIFLFPRSHSISKCPIYFFATSLLFLLPCSDSGVL